MASSVLKRLCRHADVLRFLKNDLRHCVCAHARLCGTTANNESASTEDPYKTAASIDIEKLFISDKVQQLLKNLTGMSLEKVFAPVKTALNPPRYEFMTEEQLQEAMNKAYKRAEEKLQMPPVLRERKPCEKVLAKDPEIQGYDSSTIIFTDISYGYSDRERIIVVREPNGLLRTAKWEEREQMLNTYFTTQGREFYMPKMFEPQYLQSVLEKQQYAFVLDRACMQFEPDSPDFIRVTHATYDHINANRKFADFRSTRHFGPLVFYLVIRNNVDNLLIDMILREMIVDASNLLQLYYHIHKRPYVESLLTDTGSEEEALKLIRVFVEKDSRTRSHLELALQTYQESKSRKQELEKGLSAARGLQ
ncbi:small ribosomal subunit protein mS22-like [Ornithodoros turicata]|uniref:small ribosomal subunit protein mS22-like n=1 Tax=Ornithodoros turicata TaxID=34597 RepID=UPI003139DE40